MKIELNDDQMKQLVSEAIYLQLDEKKRDEIMKAAIAHLLTPPPADRYSPKPSSPLEDAFKNAVGLVANSIARDMLEKDETIQAQIRQLISDSVNRMMTTDREIYIQKISENIAAAMTKDRY